MVFIKAEFEVGRTGSVEISCAPLDVEDSVRRGACDRSEYAAVRIISSQVSLISKNDSVQTVVRQRTRRAEVRLVADKLEIAIGAHVPLGKGRIVKLHWEWKRNLGKAIIAVVACVDCSGHDRASPAVCYILAASLHRRGSRRWGRGRCATGI